MRTTAALVLWLDVVILSGCAGQSALPRSGPPDESLPLVVTLETRHGVVTAMAGPLGSVYTVRTKDGRMLGQRLSGQELQVQLAHMHRLLTVSYPENEQGAVIWAGMLAPDPPR